MFESGDVLNAEDERARFLKGYSAVKRLKNLIVKEKINLVRLFKKFNIDSDALMSKEEFIKLIHLIDKDLSIKECMYAFQYFDNDNSG